MNPYIQSLRLRTLPLSISGIILGTGLAGFQNGLVFALALCTTLCLQILSNLCNELGDALKGTDTDQQGREAYGLQAGTITVQQMKTMIMLFIGLSMVFGTALVWTAFGTLFSEPSWVFLGLGALAIVGAIKYTLGKHSYGYIGLGDIGVFLFFGLLSTVGGYYLQTQTITAEIIWLGAAIGLPCVGVLNLNNIRDMSHDIEHGKRTFASLLGPVGARIYHTLLLVGCLAIFVCFGHWWTLAILPVWAWHLYYLYTHTERLDRHMPILMFTTLAVAVLALLPADFNRPSKVEQYKAEKHIQDSIRLEEQVRSLAYYESELERLMPVADSLIALFHYEKNDKYQDHGNYVVTGKNGVRILVRDDGKEILLYQNGKRMEHTDDPKYDQAEHLQIVILDIKELEKRIAKTSLEVQKYQKRLQKD